MSVVSVLNEAIKQSGLTSINCRLRLSPTAYRLRLSIGKPGDHVDVAHVDVNYEVPRDTAKMLAYTDAVELLKKRHLHVGDYIAYFDFAVSVA